MKHKLIAALIITTLLFIAAGSIALADTAMCDTCGKWTNIKYNGWEKVNETDHKQIAICADCGTRIQGGQVGWHTGGEATCVKRRVCDVCHGEYGPYASTHRMKSYAAKAPTCTEAGWDEYFVCQDCHLSTKKEIGPLGHDYGPWVLNNNGTHTRTCNHDSSHTETENCSGGTASCNTRAVCTKCGAHYGELYPHDLTSHEAKAATCTEIGWDAYETCKRAGCDYTTYQELPALDHDKVHHEGKAATCTEKGWKAYDTCTRCDYSTYAEILASGHSLEYHAAKAPTCTENGWDSYFACRDCGLSTKKEIASLGHSYGSWVSNGNGTHTRTCKNDSSHTETKKCFGGTASCNARAVCIMCGAEYGEKDLNNHDLTHHGAKAATCTEKGWEAYDACKNCAYTTYAEIPATGHNLTRHEAKAATCTEKGWKAYDACKNCAYTTYAEIPATGHDLTHHGAKAATCTEKGWEAYDACKNCAYTTYAEIPATGHNLTRHEAKAATCTEKGWEAYDACKNCDYTTCAEIPALGHDYQKNVVEPTCEENGYTQYTCSRCDDAYTEGLMKKLHHAFGEWMPNGDGMHSANCRREGCRHVGRTDCQKFDFNVENEHLVFCSVCGEVENGERLELIEKASAAAVTGKLPAGKLVARMKGECLSLAFELAGGLTQPTGQVKIMLQAEIVQGKRLVLIAPDGTQTDLTFEVQDREVSFMLDFTKAEVPVMLLRLIPEA